MQRKQWTGLLVGASLAVTAGTPALAGTAFSIAGFRWIIGIAHDVGFAILLRPLRVCGKHFFETFLHLVDCDSDGRLLACDIKKAICWACERSPISGQASSMVAPRPLRTARAGASVSAMRGSVAHWAARHRTPRRGAPVIGCGTPDFRRTGPGRAAQGVYGDRSCYSCYS